VLSVAKDDPEALFSMLGYSERDSYNGFKGLSSNGVTVFLYQRPNNLVVEFQCFCSIKEEHQAVSRLLSSQNELKELLTQ